MRNGQAIANFYGLAQVHVAIGPQGKPLKLRAIQRAILLEIPA